MSIKPLVQQECGQPNALVQLSSQIFSEPSTSRLLIGSKSRNNEFADEYLANYNARTAAPPTFNMQNMLREINRFPAPTTAVGKSTWAEEFLNSAHQNSANALPTNDWASECVLEDNFNTAWQSANSVHQHQPFRSQDLKWSVEYLTEAENASQQNSASYLADVANDERTWNQEFMQFVEKVDNGEISLPREDGAVAGQEQMLQSEDYWNQLEDQWDNLAKTNDEHQWLTEFNDITSLYKEYQWQDENPFLNVDDPLAEGKKLLAAGELSNAILHFEAAVQKSDENAEAWQYLGVAQAENEQEPKTIAALQKCLQLDPKNLTALQSLAIAYTNESLYDAACRTLARWLGANDRYARFAPPLDLNKLKPSSFVDRELFKTLEDAFMNATQQANGVVDSELQNVFGVLYNLSGDLDRAIDCFQTALMVRPDDSRLWNRLGATMANSSRSAEAISAYRKALELYPAFVRARYNLGISCLNLGSNRQAIEHFLSALALQYNGIGPSGKTDMSNGIWGTLRIATMGINREDLLVFVDSKDFDGFRKAFLNNAPLGGASALM